MNLLLKKCRKAMRQRMTGRLHFVASPRVGRPTRVDGMASSGDGMAEDGTTQSQLAGDYARVGAYSGDVARLLARTI